jgi:zinc/manganese transport system permease protein
MALPVVGALLIFSLMVGPPAAARSLARQPGAALGLAVMIALITVWTAIAASYESNWPVGFFVGTLGAVWYGLSRIWAAVARRRSRVLSPAPGDPLTARMGAAAP